jgi:hypothetical protein
VEQNNNKQATGKIEVFLRKAPQSFSQLLLLAYTLAYTRMLVIQRKRRNLDKHENMWQTRKLVLFQKI